MNRIFLFFILFSLFITQVGRSAQAAPESEVPEAMSKSEYITGGILASTVGFGVGHAIQGRYVPKGVIFTVLDSAALSLLIVGANADVNNNRNVAYGDSYGYTLLGVVAFVGIRVWEALDAWLVPAMDRHRAKKILEKQNTQTQFGIYPVALIPSQPPNATGLFVRFSL